MGSTSPVRCKAPVSSSRALTVNIAWFSVPTRRWSSSGAGVDQQRSWLS